MNGVPWRDPTFDLVIWLATVVTFVGVFVGVSRWFRKVEA